MENRNHELSEISGSVNSNRTSLSQKRPPNRDRHLPLTC